MSQSDNALRTIFTQAVEIENAQQRSDYLAQACGADTLLRQTIEDLIAANDAAGAFLGGVGDAVEAAAPDASAEAPLVVPVTEKAGDRIGRYKLLQQIGEGGCGVVYMAEQQEPVHRTVALKVIKLGMDTKSVIARFEAERQALALMDHPNIAKVLDAGATDTGRPYFVMELVRGVKITDHCDQNNLSTSERLSLFIKVCQAIQHAHQKGIIHRDIKPSNILVTVHDGVPVPQVIDFGIAKATQGKLTDQTLFTAVEQFLGTPAYMSPEQTEMSGLDIDTRSDIYALGVLLYELLTGQTPFDTKELLAAGLDVMRRTIREKEPVRPSTRLRAMLASELTTVAKQRQCDPPKLVHLLRGDLDWVVMKALEKDRTHRYETANGLAMEIRRYLADEPVLARPITPVEQAWRWCRRNPKIAILCGAVTLLLITVAIGSTLAAIRINRAEQAASEKLFDSYLAQAKALRHNSREGQRSESLAAVAKAAAIRPSPELRDETIACLALTDVRLTDTQQSTDPEGELWDEGVQLRAFRQHGGTISVRRVHDNSELARLPSLGAEDLNLYHFSPGGRYLAVKYTNGRTVVWDINQQQPVLNDLPDALCVDFSADGQTVAITSQDRQLRRFSLNPVRALPSLLLNRSFTALGLRPQGDWFAGSDGLSDLNLEVRDLRDGSLLRTLCHPAHIGSVAWSKDGHYLAVGCENGLVFIWNALTGEMQGELRGHQDTVTSVGFSHSGWLLGSSSWDGEFRLWDLATGRVVLSAAGWSYQSSFSADDHKIGRVQRGIQTGSLEVTTSSIFRRLNCRSSPKRGSYSTDISPDGRLVATAFMEGVRVWADHQTEEPFLLPAGPCFSVIFTPDGTNLITSGLNGLALWPLHRIPGTITDELHIGPRQTIRDGLEFNYAALSRDGTWVAAANPAAAAVSIYEVRHPSNQFELGPQSRPQSPVISPDGHWVAAGNWKGSIIKVWEFESKQLVCAVSNSISALVTFSPDNRWLAVGGDSYDLLATGSWTRKYSIVRTHPESSRAMAFSPDARMLATTVEPGIIRLVAAETGEVLANFEGPGASLISYLRFSSDGSQLFALEWDQQVQVWDLRRIRAELCKLNLDWNAPPIPPETISKAPIPKPLHIVLEERSP